MDCCDVEKLGAKIVVCRISFENITDVSRRLSFGTKYLRLVSHS
jgi:hypothetical protein